MQTASDLWSQKAHAIAILEHPLMMIDAQICWWTRASEQIVEADF